MLAALRRFIARRGHPSEIHSDNGTNFIGANNYLKQLYMLCEEHSIQKYSTDRNIRWKFIPLCSEFWRSLGVLNQAEKSVQSIFEASLVGRKNPFCPNGGLSLSCRWKSLLKLRQHFWDRWHKEVLHHYQSRPKWKASQSGGTSGQSSSDI
ncbi:integrase catalytic domain-containing protein [Trichonephila clavipes]|nr:integrase catalytic domain-containing protein [Trichonephila clavipes]